MHKIGLIILIFFQFAFITTTSAMYSNDTIYDLAQKDDQRLYDDALKLDVKFIPPEDAGIESADESDESDEEFEIDYGEYSSDSDDIELIREDEILIEEDSIQEIQEISVEYYKKPLFLSFVGVVTLTALGTALYFLFRDKSSDNNNEENLDTTRLAM